MPDPDSTAELLDDQVVSLAPAGRGSSGPVLRWLGLGVAVTIVIAVGISYAAAPGPPVAVVASPNPSATELTAVATAEPSPTANVNVCAQGSFDVQPSSGGVIGDRLRQVRLTRPGALALAIEEDRTSGWIIVARSDGDEAGTVDLGYVARFTGYDIELPRAVTPVAWTSNGDAVLVNAGHLSMSETQRTCSDLFLVQADGSSVTRLTHNGPGAWTNASSISPDGKHVAVVIAAELRLIEVDGARLSVPLATCSSPEGPVRWSPEAWLLVGCGNSIVVADLSSELRYVHGPPAGPESEGSLPRNSLLLAASWAADGASIVAITATAGPSQLGPLQTVFLDRDGTPIKRTATEASTEWVVGTSTMSPDGRWALVQGDGDVPAATWFPTYAIETETGVATKLPWTVIHDATEPSNVSWLAEAGHLLYEEEGALYEVDLTTMTRTEVGAIPAADYAWREPAS